MRLERRAERSSTMALASPFIAIALTIVTASLIFALRGNNPLQALYVYFVEPLTAVWSVEQLLVKAWPDSDRRRACRRLPCQRLEHRCRRGNRRRERSLPVPFRYFCPNGNRRLRLR